jgi:hypothetical protein
MILDGYETRGGKHPETAALKNVLAYHGVTASHTGQPFSDENAHPIGPGGGSLRDTVADFLDEASPVVKMSELKNVADQYRAIVAQWVRLADSALPSSIGPFDRAQGRPFERAKRLLVKKHELLMTVGQEGLDEMQKVTDELSSMQSELNRYFPMRDSKVTALFAKLQAQLFDIYRAEKDANAALKAAIG